MAVAGYLGLIKPDEKPEVKPITEEDNIGNLEKLAAMFASSGGIIN